MIRPESGLFARAVGLGLVWVCASAAALAATPAAERFDSPEPSWRDVGGDVTYRLDAHERTSRAAHTGSGSEYVQVNAAGNGTRVLISHDAGQAAVIEELKPSIWVLSDRAGLQAFVRVILPRTLDPKTGQPVSALLPGPNYSQVGSWQTLVIDNLPTLLERQARVLRAQLKSDVDIHEAYVDRVLLNVYGGAGQTRVWIDDLELTGYVQASNVALTAEALPPGKPAEFASVSVPMGPRPTVSLSGSILLVNDKPFFPRMIEWQGEPLAFLKSLGFNTVHVRTPPAPEMLAEAARHDLWLVGPPPEFHPEDISAVPAQLPELGPLYDRVLVWDLGSGRTDRDVQAVQRWSELLGRVDPQSDRPIICQADSGLEALSRYVELLLIRRHPLGTSFELTDYLTWLRERPRLARLGTPVWTTIQTEYPAEVREQWQLLSNGRAPNVSISSDQLRLLAYATVVAGTRGICFDSQTRLDSPDPATRLRATALELLNLELELIEPWAAAGRFVSTVKGPKPELSGAIIQADRGRLLLPMWSARGAQYVPGQSAGNNVALLLPGVAESNEVYEISPGGLSIVRYRRDTGGLQVTLDEFGMTSMLLLTQDPLVIATMTKRLKQSAPRVSDLQRQLAREQFRITAEIDTLLAAAGDRVTQAGEGIAAAQARLQSADEHFANRDYRTAYLEARRALRPLHQLERAHWEAAMKGLGSPVSSPLAVTFPTLPSQRQFAEQLKTLKWGQNLLPLGDFETPDNLERVGWRHFRHPQEGIESAVELAPDSNRKGRYSLHMRARAMDAKAPAGLVETPPVWIISPPVAVQQGQWVRIRGSLRVPVPISGSLDGLLILDSFTGEALAERIGETTGWRGFTMYRAAPQSGSMTVTFALTGLGEAWVDDVTIEPLAAPPAVPAGGVPAMPVGAPMPGFTPGMNPLRPESLPPGNRAAVRPGFLP